MRLLAPALLTVCLTFTAPAAAHAGGAPAKTTAKDEHMDLAPMGLPVISDGRIVNYVFVQARLFPGPSGDLLKLREKEPFYRDALIRAAYRTPFTVPGDWTVLDEAKVEAVLLAEARRVSGPRSLARAEILRQTPRRRTGVRASR
jgi:hypothetical protein